MSGRRDVLVVASISCIYGLGNPIEIKNQIVRVKVGEVVSRNTFLFDLVNLLYSRTVDVFSRGTFRVIGDQVDINLAYSDDAYRVTFWGDEIESIELFNPLTGKVISKMNDIAVYPASIYIAPKNEMPTIIREIQDELAAQMKFFINENKIIEAKRLEERVNFDIEMMKELGYCSGIENYSRFFDRRRIGARPFCLLDYFPDDFLMVIDESHVTVPQIGAMYGGDRSRKVNLVEYGFRLPSAIDNRPLNFNEFESMTHQTIYVSATPGDFELNRTHGEFVEQIVRPTGLLDPPIIVKPCANQVDDLLDEIHKRIEKDERVLVTTLTKRMAEELSKFFIKLGLNCKYIHSDVDTMERVEILQSLRLGEIDVLIGVNLLREGLDLPEVSLVAIMDADKEGFLRNFRSLTQTAGRAARNENGLVIMYADKITGSMQRTIDETDKRREKQIQYNIDHGMKPKTVFKSREEIIQRSTILDIREDEKKRRVAKIQESIPIVAEPNATYNTPKSLEKQIETTKKAMQKASAKMDFMEAARLRDIMYNLEKLLKEFSS
jgi:excinuclease ABC subunit B